MTLRNFFHTGYKTWNFYKYQVKFHKSYSCLSTLILYSPQWVRQTASAWRDGVSWLVCGPLDWAAPRADPGNPAASYSRRTSCSSPSAAHELVENTPGGQLVTRDFTGCTLIYQWMKCDKLEPPLDASCHHRLCGGQTECDCRCPRRDRWGAWPQNLPAQVTRQLLDSWRKLQCQTCLWNTRGRGSGLDSWCKKHQC